MSRPVRPDAFLRLGRLKAWRARREKTRQTIEFVVGWVMLIVFIVIGLIVFSYRKHSV
jgi:hypothetical protein